MVGAPGGHFPLDEAKFADDDHDRILPLADHLVGTPANPRPKFVEPSRQVACAGIYFGAHLAQANPQDLHNLRGIANAGRKRRCALATREWSDRFLFIRFQISIFLFIYFV